jgi:uncharacterized protein YfdQ (DUF2303 family)
MSLTPETIAILRQPEALDSINAELARNEIDATALPAGYSIADLEGYREHRRRLTGTMTTNCVFSFASYVVAFMKDAAPLVFVQPGTMTANCPLNFGDAEKPGHADHTALLKLEPTAAYAALLGITSQRATQQQAAEWCEDYVSFCSFLSSDVNDQFEIPASKAVRAIRNLKIDAKATATSSVDSFRGEKSLLESVAVDTSDGLPHFIRFTCVPYLGLPSRAFLVRIGTGRDRENNSVFTLKIVRHDIDVQDMAKDLATLVAGSLKGATVLLGSFTAKR